MTGQTPDIRLRMPRLYPKQHAAIFHDQRYGVVEASTKSGKTVGCIVWLLAQAFERGKPGREFWWVAPVWSQARIAYRRIKRMFQSADPGGDWWDYSDGETAITVAGGGRLVFRGSDRSDTLYGEDVYAAVVDEASRCREDAWHAIRSTLTATKGAIRIIGNVRGRQNWAYRLGRQAESGDPDMHFARLTAHDAVEGGVLDQKEIDDAKARLPEHVFRELYLAEPSDDGGNPFGIGAIHLAMRDYEPGVPAVFGIDLARSHDWTVVCGLDGAGNVAKLARWQTDWRQTRDRITRIVSDAGHPPTLIDATGVGDPIVEDLAGKLDCVNGFTFTGRSKQQIMEGLAAAIQAGEVGLPSRDEAGWLIAELEAFEYEYRGRSVYYSAPEGLHDDGVCALALAVHQVRARAPEPHWAFG